MTYMRPIFLIPLMRSKLKQTDSPSNLQSLMMIYKEKLIVQSDNAISAITIQIRKRFPHTKSGEAFLLTLFSSLLLTLTKSAADLHPSNISAKNFPFFHRLCPTLLNPYRSSVSSMITLSYSLSIWGSVSPACIHPAPVRTATGVPSMLARYLLSGSSPFSAV